MPVAIAVLCVGMGVERPDPVHAARESCVRMGQRFGGVGSRWRVRAPGRGVYGQIVRTRPTNAKCVSSHSFRKWLALALRLRRDRVSRFDLAQLPRRGKELKSDVVGVTE